jgi:hypothetical protein
MCHHHHLQRLAKKRAAMEAKAGLDEGLPSLSLSNPPLYGESL